MLHVYDLNDDGILCFSCTCLTAELESLNRSRQIRHLLWIFLPWPDWRKYFPWRVAICSSITILGWPIYVSPQLGIPQTRETRFSAFEGRQMLSLIRASSLTLCWCTMWFRRSKYSISIFSQALHRKSKFTWRRTWSFSVFKIKPGDGHIVHRTKNSSFPLVGWGSVGLDLEPDALGCCCWPSGLFWDLFFTITMS